MVRGAHQHRLVFEEDAFLPVRKNLLADGRHLSILVGAPDEAWTQSGAAVRRLKDSREPLWSFRTNAVGHIKNLLAGSVIGVEDQCPSSREGQFEIEDMARFSSAERIDGLCIVTDNRDSFVGPAQCSQDVHLQSVHVLIFINQDVIERTREVRA